MHIYSCNLFLLTPQHTLCMCKLSESTSTLNVILLSHCVRAMSEFASRSYNCGHWLLNAIIIIILSLCVSVSVSVSARCREEHNCSCTSTTAWYTHDVHENNGQFDHLITCANLFFHHWSLSLNLWLTFNLHLLVKYCCDLHYAPRETHFSLPLSLSLFSLS